MLWKCEDLCGTKVVFHILEFFLMWFRRCKIFFIPPYSIELRTKLYEINPTWPWGRSWWGPRSCEDFLESSGIPNRDWLGSCLGPHPPYVHPLCILSIGFSTCQMSISPSWRINFVVVGWSGPIECVASALPRSGWRWGSHPNRPPKNILWMAARYHPSSSWMLLEHQSSQKAWPTTQRGLLYIWRLSSIHQLILSKLGNSHTSYLSCWRN